MLKKLFNSKTPLILLLTILSITVKSAVIPYLPPLQNFGGSSVDLTNFVPVERDFTLEVQGSSGVEINICSGLIVYTPTSNDLVRFAQKNGKIYVYEGNVYKTTLTPTYSIQYAAITDANVTTNAANLLQNSSFETAGTLVSGGTNYYFGNPWTTNATVTATGGIRFGSSTTGNVNGTWECVWRGSGNDNYFAQQLSTSLKSNTSYKVITYQIATGNANANFNVGIGSTVNGLEFGNNVMKLGTSQPALVSTTFKSMPNTSGTTYFTFRNTNPNTASSGSDPVTQLDYIALVEGTVSVSSTVISGVSSATFLAGSSYSPENLLINYSGGDNFDMNSYLINPSFERVSYTPNLTSWTNTNSMAKQSNTPGQTWIKEGTYYAEKWIAAGSNLPAASLSQTISGLPNGEYKLTLSAHAIQQGNLSTVTTGAFAFGNLRSTAVNVGGDYSVENIIVSDGSLNFGFKIESPITCNWVGFDNFKLYYIRPIPTSSASGALAFTPSQTTKSLTVTGSNLTSDLSLTFSNSNFHEENNVTSISKDEAMAVGGKTINIVCDASSDISNATLTLSSTGMSDLVVNLSLLQSSAITIDTKAMFMDNSTQKTLPFTLTKSDFFNDVTLTAPAGVTLTKTSDNSSVSTISKADLAAANVGITATWNGTTRIIDGTIQLTSGSMSENITVLAVPTNIISNWDADNQESTGSELSNFGWTNTNASGISTGYLTGVYNSGGGVRLYSLVSSGHKFGGKNFLFGRTAYLRNFGDNAYSWNKSITLEAGKTYYFRGLISWHNNGNTPQLTLSIKDKQGGEAGAVTLATKTITFTGTSVGGANATDVNFKFSAPTSGTYYLVFTDNQPANNGTTLTAYNNDQMISPDFLSVEIISDNNVSSDANISDFTNVTNETGLIVGDGANLSINQNSDAKWLTVKKGGKLTVNSGSTLNGATVNLESDASGSATFVNNGTSTITTANVQQYLGSGRQWYISSPVSNATVSMINPDASTVASYNEGTGAWAVEDAASTLTPGKGYVAKQSDANRTVTFTGTLNDGNIDVNLSNNGNGGFAGYNLVGNPYPSFLNASAVINSNSHLAKSIWYRSNDGSNMVFDVVNLLDAGANVNRSGRTRLSGVIPPMQAFWLKADANTSLQFTNAMRAHTSETATPFKVAAETNLNQYLKLKVKSGINSDQCLVYFNPNAVDAKDNYDAEKINDNLVNVPQIYTVVDGKKMVINGMELKDRNLEMPLGFSTDIAGEFTIQPIEMTNLGENVKVFLNDNQTNTSTELSIDQTYTFNSDVVSSADRFTLLFKTSSTVTGFDLVPLKSNVYVNEAGRIVVELNETIKNDATIQLYTLNGQKIYEQSIDQVVEILPLQSNAMYLVKVKNQTVNSYKVIAK